MLIQFVVENFLSFRDKQILSMRAPEPGAARIGAAFDRDKQQTVRAGGEEILRCAALYGANASGKSNLVRAIERVQALVLAGTPSKQRIARRPFKLDPACRARPSRFELTFVHDEILYSYGFLLDEERIHAEWLHRGPEDGEALLFRRELDAASGQYAFEVGDALAADATRKQFYEFLHQGTRTNQLFLAEAEERNAPELDSPLAWFRDRLQVIYPDDAYAELHQAVDTDPTFGVFLTELLAQADTGIRGIRTRRVPSSVFPETVRSRMAKLLAGGEPFITPSGRFALTNSDDGDIEALALITTHGEGKNAGTFSIDEESDGTQRLMHLAPLLYTGGEAQESRVYVVDELDRSLHPLLTRFFLQEFRRAGGEQASQLICTTHDTNLLDVNLLPPSSIWFVEKDREGSSHLYSLDEFDESQIAALRDQTEEGYLAGRFGAIPFFGNRQRLVSAAKPEADGED